VFLKSWKETLESLGGWFEPMYEHSGLEALLDEKTCGRKMSEALKPLFITSFDGSTYHPLVFDSVRSRNGGSDYLMRDVGRATSAAPTYFSPHDVYSLDKSKCHKRVLDGGLVANNATGVALTGCSTLSFGEKRIPKIPTTFLLSLGTGKLGENLGYSPGGKIGWAGPLVDIFFSSTGDIVDYMVKASFRNEQCLNNYVRIQPTLAGSGCSVNMDDTTQINLDALKELGEKIARNGIKPEDATINGYNYSNGSNLTVDQIADILIENHSDIPIHQVIPIERLKSNTIHSSPLTDIDFFSFI